MAPFDFIHPTRAGLRSFFGFRPIRQAHHRHAQLSRRLPSDFFCSVQLQQTFNGAELTRWTFAEAARYGFFLTYVHPTDILQSL
jgi:hypothetical protein